MAVDWSDPVKASEAALVYQGMGYDVKFIPTYRQNEEPQPESYTYSTADVVYDGDVNSLPDVSTQVDERLEAIQWDGIRARRNRLLKETDVWAMPDRTMSQAQTDYRQALRDITTQSDPDNLVWPTKP